ncbi:TetR/AcrR family transcriptional regulator [Paenibacillus apiarius]|uniref:TetR family transcriptional regulator n=1 Tax=Paenibacillus apiarius TaxID=46240 RepID=A0ABT4DU78_9BACL|nr:TetR family transcriptional regulator [Paenibacillus apiarius]MCY9515988.1 TetR family transcriptional regulator [Paenibacillus apiarius]MCY9520898.1 TetR family transcriptional regulator [Paenibacillus apiarius]MCY9553603.1 TetR family transcriptional regulator [Paenibacillus apiarius]MCY9557874.1 TetR family transcriptional regulator [Paenibacillus apiarius]MCY9685729.1 TetR family transcriptional regulator [Paenibacillus apiarius]
MKLDEKDVKIKIMDAAKVLFARKGFEGTTVRQICDEAGVALALVSYHFGGKENVFYALFDAFAPGFLHAEYELENPEEDLRAFIREFVRLRMAEPELINLLQQEIILQSPRLDKLQRYLHALWMQLRGILEAGREKGSFDFESLKHTLHFIIGTLIFTRIAPAMDDIFESEDMQGKEESAEAIAAYTTRFILNGLK